MATNQDIAKDPNAPDNGTEAKQRTRINPRIKMVKALHSILGEQLRNNLPKEALETASDLKNYLEQITNGS